MAGAVVALELEKVVEAGGREVGGDADASGVAGAGDGLGLIAESAQVGGGESDLIAGEEDDSGGV